jgi:hypothetical protein
MDHWNVSLLPAWHILYTLGISGGLPCYRAPPVPHKHCITGSPETIHKENAVLQPHIVYKTMLHYSYRLHERGTPAKRRKRHTTFSTKHNLILSPVLTYTNSVIQHFTYPMSNTFHDKRAIKTIHTTHSQCVNTGQCGESSRKRNR